MSYISIVLPNLRGGGAERVAADLAREFRQQGHTVDFVLMQASGHLVDEVREYHGVIDLNIRRFRDLPASLYRYIGKHSPDIILGFMWPITAIVPLVVRIAGSNAKVIVAEHCILSSQYKEYGLFHAFLLRFTLVIGYNLADARVGVSKGVIEDMSMLSFLPVRFFELIYNPLRQFNNGSIDDGLSRYLTDLKKFDYRILTIGSLIEAKNQRIIIESLKYLTHINLCLIIVGEGPEYTSLKVRSSELDLTDRVYFTGFVSDPSPYYEACDVFVLASIYEGLGNVLIEALSFGMQVVSADCPTGPREVLLDGEFGTLVPNGDPKLLSEAIESTIKSPKSPNLLKLRASEFSSIEIANKYLALLN